jgi:hypothetical protein
MQKYSQAKIYAIKSPNTDKMYIGSTCDTLERRLKAHIYSYNTYQNSPKQYSSSFEIISKGSPYISLLKECPSIYRHQILLEEGNFIRLLRKDCVNIRQENLTYEEKVSQAKSYYHLYNKINSSFISQQKKAYYEKNKERIKIRARNYYHNKKKELL